MSATELYDASSDTWTATGAMVTPRLGHTATLLSNGKVLVAGGYQSSVEVQKKTVLLAGKCPKCD